MTIDPKNLTAQLTYRARGNPPSAGLGSAISNCFPGLETDFRNVWKRFLVGIEFHEAINSVVAVEPGSMAEQAGVTTDHVLTAIDDIMLVEDSAPPARLTLLVDWGNLIAPVLQKAGQNVTCKFAVVDDAGLRLSIPLQVRSIFTPGTATIDPEAAGFGELTQSLCSPWQADYRECACFYWAATRPDFVNVDAAGAAAAGHNWLHRGRTAATPKVYLQDNDPATITYEELYRSWEQLLSFEVDGKDA